MMFLSAACGGLASEADTPSPEADQTTIAGNLQMPEVEQILDPQFWLRYHLPLTLPVQPNFTLGESEVWFDSVYMHIRDWLGMSGRAQNYLSESNEVIISFEMFELYVERFFGVQTAAGIIEQANRWMQDIINWEDQTISIDFSRGPGSDLPLYNLETDTFNYQRLSWFMGHWEIIEIVPFTEDGAQKVRIVVRDYSRYLTYIYHWDDVVGFAVQSSSWRWPETNQVRIEGNVREFDTLWGLSGNQVVWYEFAWDSSVASRGSRSIDTGRQLITYGGRVYFVYTQGNELVYNSFDFAIGEQEMGVHIHDFESEEILQVIKHHSEDTFLVYTGAAAYRFGYDFELLQRQTWPPAITAEMPGGWRTAVVVNDDLSLVAFSDDTRLYLTEMSEEGAPRLINEGQNRIEPDFNNFSLDDIMLPRAVRFLDEDRLLIVHGKWDMSGTFRVIDLQGQILDEMPFNVGGDLTGGTAILNRHMVAFWAMTTEWAHPEDWPHTHVYNLTEGRLERAPWLEEMDFYPERGLIPHPNNPMVWYQTTVRRGPGHAFYRLDFERGTVTELPLDVFGAHLVTLLAVGENGELLFAYEFQSEYGFGLSTP